ncbi:MAG: type II secretion system F family protein [bacterium]|nr:type II secretion system F family protein [bacterium]
MSELNELKQHFEKIKKRARNMHEALSRISFGTTKLSTREQTLFAKRLAFLTKAGVPILESLMILKDQASSAGIARVYEKIIHDISNGQYLYKSLRRLKGSFGDFAVNIIEVGEHSGILSQNLIYLADELKKKEELRRKILGAMVYPIFITIATLGVTALLTAYIFPKIMPIFTSLHAKLPFTTRALIVMSEFLREWGVLSVIVLIICGIIFLTLHRRIPPIRMWNDRMLLHIPLAGGMAKTYNIVTFSRTVGILLRSGILLSDSLRITGDTMRNRVYRRECYRLAEKVEKGEPISRYLLKRRTLFPPMLSHMIAIGEKTGRLSDVMTYLSELYEGELDDLTKNLSVSIEPILMLVMGLIVGFVAISVITPIYDITQNLPR